jgi:NDP-sugar pyrophosphorylase family protein
VTIEYVREETALGTAGPLSQMSERLPAHFLVVNGDVLCDLDFAAFMTAHIKNDPARILSISTHRRILSSEYGVLNCTPEGLVREYSEKPSYHLAVSEGVYAFSREALAWVPRQQRFDFPDLVHRLLRENLPILACEHSGLWLDIGRPEDYEEAQRMVSGNPDRFSLFPHRNTRREGAPAQARAAQSGNEAETALPYRIQMADSFERT